jgi:molybdopterin molybdotransferase
VTLDGDTRGVAEHTLSVVDDPHTPADNATAGAPTWPPLPPMEWHTARARAHAAAVPLPSHTVALAHAAGSTLAAPLLAQSPLPAFDTAAMDGYAITGPGPWLIHGRLHAGSTYPRTLRPGEGLEVGTGAQVPAGTDAVLPYEAAHARDGRVHGQPGARTNIRRAGEDAVWGTELAAAGSRVTPAMLGLAAAAGYNLLQVRTRPRVAVLITGDELLAEGVSGHGRVRDALSPMLPPLIESLGGQPVEVRTVPDAPPHLFEAITHAAQDADVVLVTGSTSRGATDQLQRILRTGTVEPTVNGVLCRPGHPQLLAHLDGNRWLIGLPGNPYAGFVAAHTLLGPLLAGLSGQRLPALPVAPVIGPVRPSTAHTTIVPVSWATAAATILPGHRPGFLQGAAGADALAVLPPGCLDHQHAPLILLR